jgi:hypothetical protein
MEALRRGQYDHSGLIYWLPGVGSTNYHTFVQAVLGVGGATLLLATVIVLRTIGQFDQIVGRAKQVENPDRAAELLSRTSP